MRLWEWEGEKRECTRFFSDEKLHKPQNKDQYVPADDYQEDSYPLLMEFDLDADDSDTFLFDTDLQDNLARRVIHKSYITKVITDAPGENKKFDNLNIVTTVRSQKNPSNNILSYYIIIYYE